MSTQKKGKRVLVVVGIWILLFLGGGWWLANKYFPSKEKDLIQATGSDSGYDHIVPTRIDAFSGYAIWRSPVFANYLRELRIKLEFIDDGADYEGRMKALDKREALLALFPLNSFIQESEALGSYPATNVWIVDETAGADAAFTHAGGIQKIEDLNDPNARVYVLRGAPNEFLGRIIKASFSLPAMSPDWLVYMDSPEAIMDEFYKAKPGEKKLFVLWEPFVSLAVENGGRVILDSSKIRGLIQDWLTVERNFLAQNEQLIQSIIECYMRAVYYYTEETDGLVNLILEDANLTNTKLTRAGAQKIADGIIWKNTIENYQHLGVVKATQGVTYVENSFNKITDVLRKTGALQNGLSRQPHELYYKTIAQNMHDSDFHPAKAVSVLEGMGAGFDDLANARVVENVSALSNKEWGKLIPLANMDVPPLGFFRNSSKIDNPSKRELDALISRLESLPKFYIQIVGNARKGGNEKKNQKLAGDRANAVLKYMLSKGFDKNRLQAVAAKPSAQGGAAQSVEFRVLQKPF